MYRRLNFSYLHARKKAGIIRKLYWEDRDRDKSNRNRTKPYVGKLPNCMKGQLYDMMGEGVTGESVTKNAKDGEHDTAVFLLN